MSLRSTVAFASASTASAPAATCDAMSPVGVDQHGHGRAARPGTTRPSPSSRRAGRAIGNPPLACFPRRRRRPQRAAARHRSPSLPTRADPRASSGRSRSPEFQKRRSVSRPRRSASDTSAPSRDWSSTCGASVPTGRPSGSGSSAVASATSRSIHSRPGAVQLAIFAVRARRGRRTACRLPRTLRTARDPRRARRGRARTPPLRVRTSSAAPSVTKTS